ncbi:MAG TPA: BatD family protein, partial [Flavisolibacter sp.]|nr:BatD family protein [Flavisolibacter sp.]
MKKHLSVIFLFLFFGARAQKIQTIVPTQPVVVGNAFQIQYIIQEPSSLVNLTPPSFDGVQVVSGPNHYKGTTIVDGRSVAIENITYTLVPIKTGFLKINGLTAAFRSGDEKTDDAIVEVVPQPKASFSTRSSYTEVSLYAPASKTDLEKLIAENLFVRTIVDKTSCFIGEPVTATFKLYSRLQSTSEVINSPSLYGFTVMDILNTNEAHQSVETIGDKVFNTSVLRKLQLYPGQPGRLVIDPMQLQNEIDFDDSIDHHKKRIQKLLS